MTNAEKYLKNGVTPSIFCEACTTGTINVLALKEWLCQDAKLTLTEDERVILKNIGDEFNIIKRDDNGFLDLYDTYINEWTPCQIKSTLFQFIKNGEEYKIAELLKGEKNDRYQIEKLMKGE